MRGARSTFPWRGLLRLMSKLCQHNDLAAVGETGQSRHGRCAVVSSHGPPAWCRLAVQPQSIHTDTGHA
jgi:hypothetical protein